MKLAWIGGIVLISTTSFGIISQIQRTSPHVNPARVRNGDPDWQRAEKEIYASQNMLRGRAGAVKHEELRGSILREGSSRKKTISLTFDDGPHPEFTPGLLKILKDEGVPATFFVIGFMAEKYPGLIKDIKAGGNEVANHTYSHVTLTKIPSDQVLTEYKANNDVIAKITGASPKYCRPPGGDFNSDVVREATKLGMTTVLWTDDPGDYNNPGDEILLDREVAKLSPGAIILLHDGSPNTMDTLQKFIRIAKRRGFKFVTLDALSKG